MSYKKMIKQNPHLLDGRDEETVKAYYEALEWADPEVAAQPTMAASIVNNMLTTSDPAKAMQPHRDIFTTLWPIYVARKQREPRPLVPAGYGPAYGAYAGPQARKREPKEA